MNLGDVEDQTDVQCELSPPRFLLLLFVLLHCAYTWVTKKEEGRKRGKREEGKGRGRSGGVNYLPEFAEVAT